MTLEGLQVAHSRAADFALAAAAWPAHLWEHLEQLRLLLLERQHLLRQRPHLLPPLARTAPRTLLLLQIGRNVADLGRILTNLRTEHRQSPKTPLCTLCL